MIRKGTLTAPIGAFSKHIETDLVLEPGMVIRVGPEPVDHREIMVVAKDGTLIRGMYGQPRRTHGIGEPVELIGTSAET